MKTIFNKKIDSEIKLNTNRAKIVTVEGIDGSGKTTAVEKIVEKLKDQGYKAEHFITASNYNAYWETVETMQDNNLIDASTNQILHNLSFITYLKTIFIELLNDNDFVVSEWYIYGKLVLSDLYEKESKSKAIIDYYLDNDEIIKPDYSFYLDISADEAFKRITFRNERKESKESMEMLKRALLLWKEYLDKYDIEKISATKTSDEISNIIVRRITNG